ncbi:MAG: ATP-binding protein [Vicinamibacterales bacterium]
MEISLSQVRHVVAADGAAPDTAASIERAVRVARVATCGLHWIALLGPWLAPTVDLPLRAIWWLLLPAAVAQTARVVVQARGGAEPSALVGLSLAVDTLLLAGLLDITGGPFNPFLVMYGVYVWLGAVRLPRFWLATTVVLAVAGGAWLVIDHVRADPGAVHHRLNDLPTHLFTMWLAALATADLVAYYVRRGSAVLAARQRDLEEARARAARSERTASLVTLAAGAAHELSTPLGTIAVAARELERAAARLGVDATSDAVRADAALIRAEVDRCHRVLDGMSGRAGPRFRESAEPMRASAAVALAVSRLDEGQRSRVRVVAEAIDPVPALSGGEVAQALVSLLRNGFDASGPDGVVDLQVVLRDQRLCFEVRDAGHGIPPDVLPRVGEPFFTTRLSGGGRGLGVFLARLLAEQEGGRLYFQSGHGTTAVLELPVLAAAGGLP